MSDLRFSTQMSQVRGALEPRRSAGAENRSRSSSLAKSTHSPADSPKSELSAEMFHAQVAAVSASYGTGRESPAHLAEVPRKLSSFANLYATIALPYVARAAESAAVHATTLPPVEDAEEHQRPP